MIEDNPILNEIDSEQLHRGGLSHPGAQNFIDKTQKSLERIIFG